MTHPQWIGIAGAWALLLWWMFGRGMWARYRSYQKLKKDLWYRKK